MNDPTYAIYFRTDEIDELEEYLDENCGGEWEIRIDASGASGAARTEKIVFDEERDFLSFKKINAGFQHFDRRDEIDRRQIVSKVSKIPFPDRRTIDDRRVQ